MSDLNIIVDIGGTNTRVAQAREGVFVEETAKRYRNADQSGLDEILADYMAGSGCRQICVALAGPVRDGIGGVTNLDWDISEVLLRESLGAERAVLLNDLQAQGHGIAHLEAGALRELVPGPDAPDGATQLIVNVGTGFNVAPVYHSNGMTVVPASEAGHASLPLRVASDPGLILALENAHGFAAVEDMLSGRGFERVYRHLAGSELDAARIMAAVEDGSDANAREAAKLFVEMLGAVSGDLALVHLPFGGIYMVGGVARAFAGLFEQFDFASAFRAKGRFSDFMADFSVHVVEDDYAALRGCAARLNITVS